MSLGEALAQVEKAAKETLPPSITTTLQGTAQAFAASQRGLGWLLLLAILVIYFILGCFLDSISMMVLTLPVVFPVIVSLNFHPIWFGVVAVLMMEAGLITPPVGLNVYTLAGIAKDVPMAEIFKGATPFLAAIIVTTVILTIFPQIALYLPSLMGR
jgi:TRAP-type C4-dicarboxylate transport system permease large subunit